MKINFCGLQDFKLCSDVDDMEMEGDEADDIESSSDEEDTAMN